MFCPKCGAQNVDEAKFCSACGTPLTVNAAASVPQTVKAQPVSTIGGKKKLPFIIGGAAIGVIALVLTAILVITPAFNKNPFKGCQVGDVVEFGSYEQDGNASNGEEPIEWRILAVEGDRAYVVSQKALDAHAFNEDKDDGNDWNSSDLKAWLESDFVSRAFASDEMRVINEEPTLLSVEEANKYFKSDKERQCCPTNQLKQQWGWDSDVSDACGWWLRSPGADSYIAANVGSNGYVFYVGYSVDDSYGAVRPALWVSL